MYNKVGIDLYKPYLRAKMESDMKQIADGVKESRQVLRDCINSMREIYRETVGKRDRIIKLFHELMGDDRDGN